MALSRLNMNILRMFISVNLFCSIYYTGELKEDLLYRFVPVVIFPIIVVMLLMMRNWTLNKVWIHMVSRVTIRNEIGYLFFVNIILGLGFQTYAAFWGTLAVYIPEIIQFLRRRIHQPHTPR
jgi:uncharacterized protein (DUF983 family)